MSRENEIIAALADPATSLERRTALTQELARVRATASSQPRPIERSNVDLLPGGIDHRMQTTASSDWLLKIAAPDSVHPNDETPTDFDDYFEEDRRARIRYEKGGSMNRSAVRKVYVGDLQPGDVIVQEDGLPPFGQTYQEWTVQSVDGGPGMWIIDFANGTSSAPYGDGMVYVAAKRQHTAFGGRPDKWYVFGTEDDAPVSNAFDTSAEAQAWFETKKDQIRSMGYDPDTFYVGSGFPDESHLTGREGLAPWRTVSSKTASNWSFPTEGDGERSNDLIWANRQYGFKGYTAPDPDNPQKINWWIEAWGPNLDFGRRYEKRGWAISPSEAMRQAEMAQRDAVKAIQEFSWTPETGVSEANWNRTSAKTAIDDDYMDADINDMVPTTGPFNEGEWTVDGAPVMAAKRAAFDSDMDEETLDAWMSLAPGTPIRIGFEESAQDGVFMFVTPNANSEIYGNSPFVMYRTPEGVQRGFIPTRTEKPRPAKSAMKQATMTFDLSDVDRGYAAGQAGQQRLPGETHEWLIGFDAADEGRSLTDAYAEAEEAWDNEESMYGHDWHGWKEGARKTAASVVCNSCGHSFTTRNKYKVSCPECGSDNVNSASAGRDKGNSRGKYKRDSDGKFRAGSMHVAGPMFPGAGAEVYRNEAGEPMGWDYPSDPSEYANDDFYDDYDEGDDDDMDYQASMGRGARLHSTAASRRNQGQRQRRQRRTAAGGWQLQVADSFILPPLGTQYDGQRVFISNETDDKWALVRATPDGTPFDTAMGVGIWVDKAALDGVIESANRPAWRGGSLQHTAARPIYEIAADIKRVWGFSNIDYAARPYLDAMMYVSGINDMYGAESAKSLIAYFLSNASKFRGPDAKRLKDELKAIQKGGARTAAFPGLGPADKPWTRGEEWSATCPVCGGTETGTGYYNAWPSQDAFHKHLFCGTDPNANYNQDLAIDRYSSASGNHGDDGAGSSLPTEITPTQATDDFGLGWINDDENGEFDEASNWVNEDSGYERSKDAALHTASRGPWVRVVPGTGSYSGSPMWTIEVMGDEDSPGYGVWEPVTTVFDAAEAKVRAREYIAQGYSLYHSGGGIPDVSASLRTAAPADGQTSFCRLCGVQMEGQDYAWYALKASPVQRPVGPHYCVPARENGARPGEFGPDGVLMPGTPGGEGGQYDAPAGCIFDAGANAIKVASTTAGLYPDEQAAGVTTWADGYGIWHATADSEEEARRAIERELAERGEIDPQNYEVVVNLVDGRHYVEASMAPQASAYERTARRVHALPMDDAPENQVGVEGYEPGVMFDPEEYKPFDGPEGAANLDWAQGVSNSLNRNFQVSASTDDTAIFEA